MSDWRKQVDLDETSEATTLKRIGAVTSGAILVVLGTLSAATSLGPLRNLFAEYQDSPASTYLLFGLPFLLGGLIAIGLGFWLLSKARRTSADRA